MDSKKTADRLRELASQVESTADLQGVAIIMPPDNQGGMAPIAPIVIILAGTPQPNFSQYIISQIMGSAAPPGMLPGMR